MFPARTEEMPEWLRQRARLSPGRPAILHETGCLTYAELDGRVAAMARRLARAGVSVGDHVALLARNSPEFAGAVHAITRLGAVVVPLHARWTPAELAATLRDCGASILVHDDSSAPAASDLVRALPATRCVPIGSARQEEEYGAGDDFAGGGLRNDPCAGDDRATVSAPINLSAAHSIVYTSGTSGTPKGAVLTFANHLWNVLGSVLNLGLREDDRWLACLPLYHVGGLAILLRGVIYGIPVVLHERFDPAAANRDIDEKGVTIISVVSTMLQRMLEERRPDRPYPPSLRCVLVGGGPVPEPLLEQCARRRVPLVQTYGLTEAASQVTTLAPGDAPRRPGSAGRPLFCTEVRIADDRDETLPPGASGEILVRGLTVTGGYLGRPEETEEALRGGWLHTGDVGYLDDDGYLYVRDRRDGLIISGGENVFAAEVEAALCAHPAVRESAVTGVPDARWGECVVATVSLHEGAHVGEADLIAFCRNRIAPYKVPKRVRFTEALPRNAAGKLLRRLLREDD